jgi:hypothetical protein
MAIPFAVFIGQFLFISLPQVLTPATRAILWSQTWRSDGKESAHGMRSLAQRKEQTCPNLDKFFFPHGA